MPFINHAAREINCKIVYYGPGLGGKTTNIRYIHDHAPGSSRGRLVSLATETDRTLFFDFLPVELGTIGGFRARFHLYTVPGQIFYDASRKLILKGADGVVLVADSQEERMDANLESLRNLVGNVEEQNGGFLRMPYVLQLNKRDLPRALPAAEMARLLRAKDEAILEAVATKGTGVFDTLRAIAKRVLLNLRNT